MSKSLLTTQQSKSDQLYRTRKKGPRHFSFLGLKKEYKTALLLVGMINLLLFVNNLLDLQHVWGSMEPQNHAVLRQFVHEGTYFLIASIFLSMGIMLYFFRGNLNFLQKNKLLRVMSYAWIAQNALLTLSVGMRNVHYISQYGLAYKRVGVFFFLLLTLFGLFTLYLKIRDRMSTYYLFKTNSWALYVTMIGMSMVNWDMAIARYNFRHYEQTQQIDTGFLLALSHKTIPILMEHQEVFPNAQRLRDKQHQFWEEWNETTWLSWNWADHKTSQYLKKE